MKKCFALRKITNGKIKINDRYYQPDETYLEYDGRLEGIKFVFGLYYNHEQTISLWGTKDQYDNPGEIDQQVGPHVVDGSLPWLFWNCIKK